MRQPRCRDMLARSIASMGTTETRKMPPLKNIRHETFCRKIVEGKRHGLSQADAYLASGYRCEPGPPAEAAASRLLSSVTVKDRIIELMAPAARKAGVTVETLLAEYDEVRDLAKADKQLSVAKSATDSKGKLTGLMRDQIELGRPGDFDRCQSPTDVVDALLGAMDTDEALTTLDALRSLVESRAANQARVIPPNANGHAIETRLAIEQMRPRRR